MRRGVIVGLSNVTVTRDDADRMMADLTYRFPGVTFAFIPGADSIAFEFDEEEDVA